MEHATHEELGLNTRDALNKLYVEIESVLQQFKHSQKSRLVTLYMCIFSAKQCKLVFVQLSIKFLS